MTVKTAPSPFFEAAPVGDPKKKVRLTVQAHPNGSPNLVVIVHRGEGDDDVLFDFEIPYDALILVGLPAQGLLHAADMVRLLVKAAAAIPVWTKGRAKYIIDAPVTA